MLKEYLVEFSFKVDGDDEQFTGERYVELDFTEEEVNKEGIVDEDGLVTEYEKNKIKEELMVMQDATEITIIEIQ